MLNLMDIFINKKMLIGILAVGVGLGLFLLGNKWINTLIWNGSRGGTQTFSPIAKISKKLAGLLDWLKITALIKGLFQNKNPDWIKK